MDSRTKRFELRLNAHEKEVLKERAAKAGVPVSDLVRLALAYADRLTVRTIDISPLRDLCYELTKQGTNLNQFMKFLNTYGGDAYNRVAAKQLIEKIPVYRKIETENYEEQRKYQQLLQMSQTKRRKK